MLQANGVHISNVNSSNSSVKHLIHHRHQNKHNILATPPALPKALLFSPLFSSSPFSLASAEAHLALRNKAGDRIKAGGEQ
jgi:hypothetical protein